MPNTASTSDLEALLARVEAAQGPDRRLADDVMLACGWRCNTWGHDDVVYEGEDGSTYSVSYEEAAGDACWYPPGTQNWIHGHVRPDPTASLDACLALQEQVLPGRKVSLANWSSENEHAPRARVFENSVFDAEWARAATLPLALLAALIRALIAQAKEQAT